MSCVEVYRDRTTVHLVSLGYNPTGANFISQIRETRSPKSRLIATWDIDIVGDGRTGELRLSLDNGITKEIAQTVGYMDIIKEEGGEPYPVLNSPLLVCFLDLPSEPSPEPEL